MDVDHEVMKKVFGGGFWEFSILFSGGGITLMTLLADKKTWLCIVISKAHNHSSFFILSIGGFGSIAIGFVLLSISFNSEISCLFKFGSLTAYLSVSPCSCCLNVTGSVTNRI